MDNFDYDLFVIGAGSGGVRAARMAAARGVRVAVAESRHLGGTCVNVGCVPKKLFVYASHFQDDFKAAQGFGWHVEAPKFEWERLLKQKNSEIERLQKVYSGLLQNSSVKIMTGQAGLLDEHTVQVGDHRYRSRRILIATGSWPSIPDIPGKEHIVSSNEMFHLPALPRRLLIVGGGYIAVEFAGIMHGLGVETTLCYRGDRLLRGFDEDIRLFLADEMQKKGIKVLFNTDIAAIERRTDYYCVTTKQGLEMETELVLYATGRKPNIEGLGLEKLGITLEQGRIKTDAHYQTNIPSIYAIGDVSSRFSLTPVATAEAMALVDQIYAGNNTTVDYDNIPTAVFSQPNVGTVGLTEAEAKKRFGKIKVYRSVFTPMKHTLSGLKEKTLMKMVVDVDSDKVLGIHMVGAEAGEIIQGMAVAIRAGATKAIFDTTIGIHPTAAEEFVTMRNSVD